MRNEQYGNKLLPKQSANEYAHCKSKMLLPEIIWLFYILDMINCKYSKASRYTASRSADLGDTRFLIGSQNT